MSNECVDDGNNNRNECVDDGNNNRNECVDDGNNNHNNDGDWWEVHKFGGTSLASSECYRKVASIVFNQLYNESPSSNKNNNNNDSSSNGRRKRVAVVVSAMGAKKPDVKVTDLLLSCVKQAARREESRVLESTYERIVEKHKGCILGLSDVLPLEEQERLVAVVKHDMEDVKDILKTVYLMKWEAERISELVSGYGEIWSAQIMASLLQHLHHDSSATTTTSSTDYEEHQFVYLDARTVITIDEQAMQQSGAVCWDISQQNLNSLLHSNNNTTNTATNPLQHYVMTGFIASNTHGVATTLQRDGSDYSAAILGRLLTASSINIWTDVDGVLSADPKRVPHAHVIPQVSYNEAMELAYFGAKVIHPKTMQPAIMTLPQIPIYIKNTFNPAFQGSKIYTSSTTHTSRDKCVCGFSSVEHMALINVEGTGLMGVPGVASRLFQCLEQAQVNVVLISQASSEHSITFATSEQQAPMAKQAVEQVFHKELRNQHMQDVVITAPCSIIAAVGDGMSSTAGVSGLFFSALGDAGINVMAISQGCSERNISAVVMTSQSSRALRAVHAAFHLSYTSIRIGIVGMDELGRSLLKLLETERAKLREAFEVDLQVCGVIHNDNHHNTTTTTTLVTLKEEAAKPNSRNESGEVYSITPHAYQVATEGMGLLGRSKDGGGPVASAFYQGSDFAQALHFHHSSTAAAAAGGSSSSAATSSSSSSSGSATPTRHPPPHNAKQRAAMEELVHHVASKDHAHAILFDCTADESIATYHPRWLHSNIHVITANNTALSGPLQLRQSLDKAEKTNGKTGAQYLREVATCGGLPVVSTVRELLATGDQIRRLDGIVSISMSYIMHRIAPPPGVQECWGFDEVWSKGAFCPTTGGGIYNSGSGSGGCCLSQAVKEAVALGLMEQDPLKDLSNEHAARCLMVLAKELGMGEDVDVESIQKASDQLLHPNTNHDYHDNEKDKEDAYDGMKKFEQVYAAPLDAMMKERVAHAARQGCVPRHVCSIDVRSGDIEIKIVDVPCTHAFAVNPPGCEVVRFFTHRHKRSPLVVQGPAEGADSTASALLAELLQLMKSKVGVKAGALSRTASSAYLR